jgi:hypothetical protein
MIAAEVTMAVADRAGVVVRGQSGRMRKITLPHTRGAGRARVEKVNFS